MKPLENRQPQAHPAVSPSGQAQLIAGKRDQFGLIAGPLPGSLNLLNGIPVDDKGVIYVVTENAVVRIVQ